MKLIRWFLGRIILTSDFILTPKEIKRSADAQKEVDKKASQMALYQFSACPFCVKVRRVMKRKSVNIELRDVKNNRQYRAELAAGGGRIKVPCLRIEKEGKVEWMYESSDIVSYIKTEFA